MATSMSGIFSVNGQMNLRAQKRQVTNYVESHLPNKALAAGVTVLVMEVACNKAGCVPVETSVMILFPSIPGWNEPVLIDKDLVATGKYTTAILKPLVEVTKEDVTANLPPELGGTFTAASASLAIRDVMLNNIEQTFGDGVEDKALAVDFLIESLKEYKASQFTVPEEGSFTPPAQAVIVKLGTEAGNFVIKRAPDPTPPPLANETATTATATATATTATANSLSPSPPAAPTVFTARKITAITNVVATSTTSSGAAAALNAMTAREHAPGIRRRGCPCCEPDDPENVADMMMML